MCKYKDHNECYQKAREIDPWFPHSLEEIIIWTVERETGERTMNSLYNYIGLCQYLHAT